MPSRFVDLVAEEAGKTGDTRVAFNMLLTAETLAEQANAEWICEKHLTDAVKIVAYTS
ncbi:hypothetical protein KEJ39_09265 [Candidatus Bathyarchaeota archaeon]|nr:hypothetical protein [Candidatus Bathyarchaeota archaeon]